VRDDDPDTASGVPRADTRLLSRILTTWAELVAVGFVGAALGGAASGPPQLVVYLATILASVAVLLYNVDRLITTRLGSAS
jgi:hypothetical protein